MTAILRTANLEPVNENDNADLHWLRQVVTDGGCDHSQPALCGQRPIDLWNAEILFPVSADAFCIDCLRALGAMAEAEDAPEFVVRVGAA